MKDFSSRISTLSQKQLVLLATQLRSQLDKLERGVREPIAVIGIGCRFPGGADDPEAFWHVLQSGMDTIQEIPAQRWNVDTFYDSISQTPGKISTRWAGLLNRTDEFDAGFFGIAPREAISMDPQQRLLLEIAWEALERAGLSPAKLAGTQTGVFIGISSSDYYQLQLSEGYAKIDAYFASGNAHSVASGRLSYTLGLQGPCLSVDTACSSSLVAVHLAVQSLRNSECDAALAGGVNLILSPEITIALSKAEMMAADGRCKAFDARADGFVRGEGCGLLVLKRLSDAVRDNDRVLALIRGSAINQDGRSNGLTAPNGPSQEAVIESALANGGVQSREIGYLETHGTGTALGDPIEIRALAAVLCRDRSFKNALQIGSVKTNTGHLESAAGVVGLIKVILALQNEEIPPNLHFETPNPNIEWGELPVAVVTERKQWPVGERRRLAGVSSFGFSGTNAHVILEEAPLRKPADAALERRSHLLTLSAKNEAALRDLSARYANDLQVNTERSIGDVCYTANTGRAHFNHRLAVLGRTRVQIQQALAVFGSGGSSVEIQAGLCKGVSPPDVVFLFTGQGAQYVEMGRCLYETHPRFRETLDRCSTILTPYLEKPLLSVLYPTAAEKAQRESILDWTGYTQPAIFSLDYALADLWRSWGVEPTAVMGHSLGEFVAACVAGVFSLEDGLKLVAERARLMQALPAGGSMAAVFVDPTLVEHAIAAYTETLSISALNGPDHTVISGAEADLEAVLQQFEKRGISFKRLKVSHAFHSPLMEPALDSFEKIAAAIRYHAPEIEVIANVTGRAAGTDDLTTPAYWRRHARQPVQFEASLRRLYGEGHRIFLELGPSPILTGMASRFISDADAVWLPSLRRGQDEWEQILKTLGALYNKGVNIDWDAFECHWPRRKVVLPTYPFQRKRYWYEASRQPAAAMIPKEPAPWREWLYELRWELGAWAGTGDCRHDQDNASDQQATDGFWMILTDAGGTGTKLAEVLRSKGHVCITAAKGTSFAIVREGSFSIDPGNQDDYRRWIATGMEHVAAPCLGVINCLALDEKFFPPDGGRDLDRYQKNICGSALYLTQALVSRETASPPTLYLITRGAQPVEPSDGSLSVLQTSLGGLARVIALEHPELRCKCIDLDPHPQANEMHQLADEMLAAEVQEQQMALRHGKWWVPRVAPKDSGSTIAAGLSFGIRSDGAYLITGGIAGLGLRLAQWLVEKGARHLILMGRRGATEAAGKAIEQMQQKGARVAIARGDVAAPEDVKSAITALGNESAPLRGVFHCAGTLDDGILLQQNWDRFRTVMAAKVQGAWNLHELTRNHSLDCFVLFSSAAAILGSPGQGNYAAANAFLDGLAHHRRRQGMPGLSVNWGAWNKIGMASRRGVVERLQIQGHGSLEPEQGLAILEYLLGSDAIQVAVLPVLWSVLAAKFGSRPEMRLIEKLPHTSPKAETAAQTVHQEAAFLQQWIKTPAGKRRNFLLDKIHFEAAQALGLQPVEQIDTHQPLTDLGLDSLMAVQLRNALSSLTGQPLPATLLFNYPSLDQLASYLDGVLRPIPGTQAAPELRACEGRRSEENESSQAEGLDQLSEDEMVHLLADKLKEL